MCKGSATSTQRPKLRPNSTHHMDQYIVMAMARPGDAQDCIQEPAVVGRPCAPPLAYDLEPTGKSPVLRALHPERCRACRCDVGTRVCSPRRATGLDALGAHRSHTMGPVPRLYMCLSSSLSGGNGVQYLVGLAFGPRRHGEDRGISELRGAFVESRTFSCPSAEIMPCCAH